MVACVRRARATIAVLGDFLALLASRCRAGTLSLRTVGVA